MAKQSFARVLIVDPCPAFYNGLSDWLEQEGYAVLPLAQGVQEALTHVSAANAIVVGPTLLPPLNLQLCRALRGVTQDHPSLIMSPHAEDSIFLADAAFSGAQGCVSNGIDRVQFAAAFTAVRQGLLLYPPKILAEASHLIELSSREQEILKALSENKTDGQIATMLHLSIHTVGNHLQKIYNKLGVKNRRDAVHRARHRGLL